MKRSLGTKLYYSIGEVADLTQLQPHTLRAWEKEFSCLRPKRMGKNRAYRERDIGVILLIHRLLYQERYSTRGAQLRLRNEPDLIRAATDNVAALLRGDAIVLPLRETSVSESSVSESSVSASSIPGTAVPDEQVAAASQAVPAHVSPIQNAPPAPTSRPANNRSSARIEAVRQQVLSELRELVSLLT